MDPNQGRARKMEARMVSIFVHAGIVCVAFLMVHHANKTILPDKNDAVFLKSEFLSQYDDGQGSGGGGGGKHEKEPAATGVMPAGARIQMMAPDPLMAPLRIAENIMALLPSVQMPIDIPKNNELPIGVYGQPNNSTSSGSGDGGGIGDRGHGTGVGNGNKGGYGDGENGGVGGGPDGHMKGSSKIYEPGSGIRNPEALVQPKPIYTEEGRRARAEGSVILQVVVRMNGTVDNIKVVRSLGYGLDESAIRTIESQWRFRPGTLNGLPVDALINIEVIFHLY